MLAVEVGQQAFGEKGCTATTILLLLCAECCVVLIVMLAMCLKLTKVNDKSQLNRSISQIAVVFLNFVISLSFSPKACVTNYYSGVLLLIL